MRVLSQFGGGIAAGVRDAVPDVEVVEVPTDGEVDPSIQVLVRLEIEIIVLTPKFGVVVRFRKEPSGP